jgi:hypothetical protein
MTSFENQFARKHKALQIDLERQAGRAAEIQINGS